MWEYIKEIMKCVIFLALIVALLLPAGCTTTSFSKETGFRVLRVEGTSMEPTLNASSRVYVYPICFENRQENMMILWQPSWSEKTNVICLIS